MANILGISGSSMPFPRAPVAVVALLIMLGVACSSTGEGDKTPARGRDKLRTTLVRPGPGVSQDEADRAATVVLADSRLGDVINFKTVTVRTHSEGFQVDGVLRVPIAEDQYPLDTCTVPHEGPVTGIRWLVNSDISRIRAVSPVWGTVSCF